MASASSALPSFRRSPPPTRYAVAREARRIRRPRPAHRRLEKGDGLAVAGDRALQIAEVLHEGIPLDVADLLVGNGELAPQLAIPRGLLRELVQVLERALDDERPGRRRAGQVPDRVVELEEKGVGHLAVLVEPPLGAGLRRPRAARLAQRRKDAGRKGRQDQGRRGHADAVAADELLRPVRG
jgi:hypothetical protein